MFLKPKSSVTNPPALLYKRFIAIEDSRNLNVLYKTIDDLLWTFNYQDIEFNQFTQSVPDNAKIINITTTTILTFLKYYCYYTDKWNSVTTLNIDGLTLLSASYNNIGKKYQTNKYYFNGSFDYMIRGDQTNSDGQYIKGLITPFKSINIRTFNDDVKLEPEDLVVVDGVLYSIESIELNQKRLPKPFNIYFATLNSVL